MKEIVHWGQRRFDWTDRRLGKDPRGSWVLEVANQFLFLGIDTDDRQTLRGEAVLLFSDIEELLIAVGVLGGGNLFAVHAKPEIHLLQQTAYRVLACGDPQSGELPGDFARRPAGPLDARHGVADCIVLHQFFDAGDDFGRFFSTGLRPPPALRIRSTSKSRSMSSRRPLATV